MESSDIFLTSLNESSSKTTILFFHGLFSSHREYTWVTPHLEDYHILLVDLPGHSNSKNVSLTIPSTVESLANIIKIHANNGRAHVVGLSLGGFIAMQLAKAHPELVESVFASGCAPFAGYRKWLAEHPRILYVNNGLLFWCPDFLYWWLCRKVGIARHEDLRRDIKGNYSLELTKIGFGEVLKITKDNITGIEGRIAVVAGGKQDPIEATREMGRMLGEGSEAFVVKDALHGWDNQFPEVFAKGVRAWIERASMPEEYEALD